MKKTRLLNKLFIKLGLTLALFALMLIPAVSYADTINSTLKIGSRNSEVTSLQSFLATDSSIYPQGLVTGYFGSLTKAAVIRFQTRNGLSADGIVGPNTRAVLNAQMGGSLSGSGAPMISNVYVSSNSNGATVNWSTNNLARGVVYYSTSPLVTYERENSVDVSGQMAMTDTNSRNSQNVAISNLQPNTTYYYMVYATDQNGNVSVTWPSTFTTSQ